MVDKAWKIKNVSLNQTSVNDGNQKCKHISRSQEICLKEYTAKSSQLSRLHNSVLQIYFREENTNIIRHIIILYEYPSSKTLRHGRIAHIVCPGSLDPIYIASYYLNVPRFLGQLVLTILSLVRAFEERYSPRFCFELFCFYSIDDLIERKSIWTPCDDLTKVCRNVITKEDHYDQEC